MNRRTMIGLGTAWMLTPRTAGGAAEPSKLTMPFRYQTFGVGGDNEVDTVTLKKGEEAAWASRSLLSAIQSLQFSIREVKDLTSAQLQPKKDYTTDRVPLDANEIAEHNRTNPTLAIQADLMYSVEHVFSFGFGDREINTVIKSLLFSKARLARDWKQVKMYSGQFFAARLLEAFRKQLAKKP